MGNIVGVDLKLDQEYLAASVQEIVRASIVQALGDPSKIVRNAIDSVINKKVDADGRPSTGYYATPYLDWLATRTVESTVREIMKETIEERKDEFKEALKAQLSTKKFKDQTAAAFVKMMVGAAEQSYKLPISVNFEIPKDN